MLRRCAQIGLVCILLGSGCSDDTPGVTDGGVGGSDAGPLARGVTIETLLLDFGAVVMTSTHTASLTLTNENLDPVKVTVTEPMGSQAERFTRTLDAAGSGSTFEIPGQGTVTVTMTVSPTQLGPIATNLLIESCQGECPVLVEVRAEGVETGIECSTPIDVGLVFPGTCALRAATCTNRGNVTESISAVLLAEGSNPSFSLMAPTLPAALARGEVLEVDFEYCPSDAAEAEAGVLIQTDDPFVTEQLVVLTGKGGGPKVDCQPASIDFGLVGVGGAGRAAYTCFNDGFDGATLEFSLGSGTDFRLGVATASIAAGTSAVIEVTATPGAAGSVQDTLTVTTNDGANPEFIVALSAQGIVIAPCVTESAPGSLDFKVVALGDLRAAPVRVHNSGTVDCLISDAFVTAGRDHFGVRGLPARGSALAPGDTLVFEVTFAPQVSAILEGAVELTFGNPGDNRLPIPMLGQGGPSGLVPEPTAIDFGEVPASCAAPITRTVTLRRISDAPTSISNVVVDSDTAGAFELVNPVTPGPLDFYETVSFEVGFTPNGEGLYSGQIRVFFGLPTPIVIPLLAEARASTERNDATLVSPPVIDILMVIDDSGGNTQIQANLAASISALTTRLVERQADFHIGVVSTDMEEANRQGRLIGTPAFFDQNSSDLTSELAMRVQLGTEGSGTEQGLAASLAALTSPHREQANADFRRGNADLAIIYVSSEDDQSPSEVSAQLLLETFRGITRGRRLFLGGLLGPPNGECDGPSGSAVSAERYATLLGRHDDDLLLSYCADATANLEALADRLLGGDISLSGTPVIDQISLLVNSNDVPQTSAGNRNWGYDLASNSVVLFDTQISNGDTIEVVYPLVCVPATCGDTQTDPGEYCDDGNAVAEDSCVECRNAVCGDGITWVGTEACDDGNLVEDDACLTSCIAAQCGDGIVQVGVEACDDGNTSGGDACPATCRFYQSGGLQPFAFEPLQNGSALTFSDNDDGRTSVSLPFSFDFGGVVTSSLAVSINGFASVLSVDPATSFDNTAIPDSAVPNGLLAPWWDDLVLDDSINGGAATSTAVLGTAPDRRYVIEWRDLRSAAHSTNAHRRWTFQLILEETTNLIVFRYADTETSGRVPSAVTASAGLEDEGGNLGIEALGCSPGCAGPRRTGTRPTGFPEQSEVIFTP